MTRPLPAFVPARLALALVLAAASGCALIDPYNIVGRQIPPLGSGAPTSHLPESEPAAAATTLPESVRAQAFDFVWQTISDRYYDANLNGVDWKAAGERYRPMAMAAKDDEEFWETLDRLTGEMKDAHTRVESPRRAELIRNQESISLGFSFLPIQGRLVVSGVHSDSDAWWAGVRSGMAIARIDGEDAQAVYAKHLAVARIDSTERSRHMRAVRKIVAGEPDSKASFTFEREDGSRFDATLRRRRISTAAAVSHRVLPSGLGYVNLTQWTMGATSRAIEAVKELKGTPGLIIDLRANPGGSLPAVNSMLGHFVPGKTTIGKSITRTGKPISLLFGALEVIKLNQEIDGDPEAYLGPVVILVSASSGSGSEYFSGALQALKRATIVGQPTCGCLLGFLGYAKLPGGGELAYSEVGFTFLNGKRIEGEGVIPDAQVPLTMADLRLNRDRALEQAQALLAKMEPWKKS